MQTITEKDLLEIGFEPEWRDTWENGNKERVPVKTGRYLLKSFDPVPIIELSGSGGSGLIDRLQFKVRDQEELDKFMTKAIPAFCDLT